jgi:hypothetical protein
LWLAEAMKVDAAVFSSPACPSADIDQLLDSLLRLGVAAAQSVEQSLARIRNHAT